MKIALICTEKLPVPPVAGGAVQLYIEGIVPYLSKQHDITVFSIAYEGLPLEEIEDHVKYIRIPAKTVKAYLNGIKARLNGSFELVHIFNRPLWVLSLSEELPKVRFSLSVHNEMFHPEKITDVEGSICIQRVEFINTVSRFIADGIKSRFPIAAEKLRVVYSGADLVKYKPAWSEEGLENKIRLKSQYEIQNYKVVLYVGRLSEKKGTHILLRAMKKVMEQYGNTALVIIGSKWYGKNEADEYTRKLQTIAQELQGPIIFTGFLPPSQIYSHYNMADIFVCLSQWNEPLARVHYEAMAAGLPIITTHRGGNAEVVAGLRNGIVIEDYRNPDSFAGSIAYLLDNPAVASEMGRQGRKLAEEVYHWERVAGEVIGPVSASPIQAVVYPSRPQNPPIQKKSEAALPPQADDFFTADF